MLEKLKYIHVFQISPYHYSRHPQPIAAHCSTLATPSSSYLAEYYSFRYLIGAIFFI